MTIDEAIAHAREVANEQKRRSGICVQNNSECDKFSACLKCSKEHEQLAEWLTQLKEYQQLEGQGRLIKLPCKVGDTLYRLVPNLYRKYVEIKIAQFVINKNEIYFTTNKGASWSVGKIGKTIFRTKAEAEAKLKELRGNQMKCDECNNANICLDHIRFPSICGCRSGIPDHKITTNADRIRNMSDEELAEFLVTFKNTFGEEYEGQGSCLDWLQSEEE